MNYRSFLRRLFIVSLVLGGGGSALAATVTWSGGSGTWDASTGTSWVGGTAPGAADDVLFNAAGNNVADAVTLSGIVTVNSLTIDDTAATTFTTTTANYFRLGAGGLTIASGVPALSLNQFGLEASQTWTNSSASAVALGVNSMIADPNATGPITLTLSGGTWNGSASGTVFIDNGSGKALSLVIAGGAAVNFQKGNSYTGDTTIKSGSLEVKGAGEIGTGTLYIGDASGSTSASFLANINGTQTNNTVVQGTGTDSIVLWGSGVTTTFSGTTTLNNSLSISSSVNSTTSPTAIFSGVVSGSGGLSVVANASKVPTVQLSQANTYGGGTTVNVGTLLVSNTSGSGTGTGGVSISSGATLGGTGIIAPTGTNGITVASGGIVSPGGVSSVAIGTLTLNGAGTTANLLTLASGAKFAFDLGASNAADEIKFLNFTAGDLTLNGNAFAFTGAQAGTFLLFQFYSDSGTTLASSGLSASNFNLAGSTGLTGLNASLDFSTNGAVYLDVAAVPEPGVLSLMAFGLVLGGLGWMRDRRIA